MNKLGPIAPVESNRVPESSLTAEKAIIFHMAIASDFR
jgi:hypothetical protein